MFPDFGTIFPDFGINFPDFGTDFPIFCHERKKERGQGSRKRRRGRLEDAGNPRAPC